MIDRTYLFVKSGVAVFLLSTLSSNAFSQTFADDFNTDTLNPGFQVSTSAISNPESVITTDDAGAIINIIHSDPASSERASYEWRNDTTRNSVRATGEFLGPRPSAGNLRFEASGILFNSLTDGGGDPNTRTDDVRIEITLRLGSVPEDDSANVCFSILDSEGNSDPLSEESQECIDFQLPSLDINTPYVTELGIDPDTQELFSKLNGERIAVASPFEMFEPNSPFAFARFRVRDGAETGQFRLSALEFDDNIVDTTRLDIFDRYATEDFDTFTGDSTRSKTIEDGRLLLTASVDAMNSANESFLRFQDTVDYIEADLLFSSETEIDTSNGGFGAVRLQGIMYNEISADNDAGNLGSVFSLIQLIDQSETGLVAEYCILRSDNADFSESTDLADGLDDNRCPTFDLNVEVDTVYNARMSLNQAERTLTLILADQEIVYDITTDVFKRESRLRLSSRIGFGATGTIVGYFDNLRNDPDALTDEEIIAAMNSGNSTDSDVSTSSSGEDGGAGGSVGGSSGNSGGGGGCTIYGDQKEYSMLLMILISIGVLSMRRRRRVT